MHHHAAPGSPEISISLILALVCIATLYSCGWLRLRSASESVPAWRALGFLFGLFLIWVAAGSPISALDHELLTVHMIQHLLLMTVAAPLLLLGEPVSTLLHGLPERLVRGAGPLFRRPAPQSLGTTLTNPVFCWLAATATLVGWHVPALFALGLRSEAWHVFEQVGFFGTGLMFWWPVIQPWPSVSSGPGWSMVVYLFLATLPCDILSGFLVFSERVAYPVYVSASRQSTLSVLADQQCAGALMWTAVTVIYLVAGGVLSTRLLSPQSNLQSLEVL